MKSFRKNMNGFAHHAVLGLVVIGVITVAGVKVLGGIHAAAPRYVVEGFVTYNGSPVAGAAVIHYGVPPTANIVGFTVQSGTKGWYQYYVKANATFRMYAFSSKCIGGIAYGSADIKYQTGSTGGYVRKDLALNQKEKCW